MTGGIGEGLVLDITRAKGKELAGAGNPGSTVLVSGGSGAMVGPGSGVFPCTTERDRIHLGMASCTCRGNRIGY